MYRDFVVMRRTLALDGKSETWLTVDGRVTNARNVLHGGALCDLLDSAIASAIHSTLPPGMGAVTANLTVDFIRPVPEGQELVAYGYVVHMGRHLARGRAEARSQGELVGTASGTWKLLQKSAAVYRGEGSGSEPS